MKKDQSRLLGLSILISFISYAGGSILLTEPHTAMLGGFTVVIIHTVSNFTWIACISRWLLPKQETGATIYSFVSCFATIIVAVGGIALTSTIHDDNLYAFGVRMNFLCYQSGMLLWGIGGCIACWILIRRAVVLTKWFRFGFLTYFIFSFGCMLEWFGYPYALYCSVPGALYELGLAAWAIRGLPEPNSNQEQGD